MKTAISVPNEVFTSADRLAKRLHMSRSQLYTQAVYKYVAGHDQQKVREQLDAVYATEPSSVDPSVIRAQAASLPREEW